MPISGSFTPQPQQRVVQLAEGAQRPELIARAGIASAIVGLRRAPGR